MSTAQRTKVNNRIAQATSVPKVCIVTDSALVRAIVRGLSIFNPRLRVFAPSQWTALCSWLLLGTAGREDLVPAIRALERDVLGAGRVRTVAALAVQQK